MASVTINGTEYDLDKMSSDAQNQLVNLHFVDQEIARLKSLLAIAHTARNAYAKAVEDALTTYGFSSESSQASS